MPSASTHDDSGLDGLVSKVGHRLAELAAQWSWSSI